MYSSPMDLQAHCLSSPTIIFQKIFIVTGYRVDLLCYSMPVLAAVKMLYVQFHCSLSSDIFHQTVSTIIGQL